MSALQSIATILAVVVLACLIGLSILAAITAQPWVSVTLAAAGYCWADMTNLFGSDDDDDLELVEDDE